MRIHRRAVCVGIALGLSLAPLIAQSRSVHAWEGTLTIPTYQLGPADPNPPFSLVNSHPVYPYAMLDDLTDQRVMKAYRAIYLENRYLKITILPQLGGHVYSIYDKIDQREVLYRNHVIKYGLVGPRGAWISGGMEFSFPFAHTTDTVSTVESTLRQNADGSATAVVGAVDWVSNMYWQIALTLQPNTARMKEEVTLFNSTPLNHLYLFWTNAAVRVTDDMQYIYPMRETISDDPFAIVQSWPVWQGVDQSWYKNDPSAMAIFARDVHRNFFGVYYHQSNYGLVHVANFRQDPGKKIWTWGTAPSGTIWKHILSDNDGPYGEIQSGRFYTQGYREFINPRRIENWTEYWYPVRGLNDGFVEATSQMAVNAAYLKGNEDKPEVNVSVSPVADVADATLVVKEGPKLLRKVRHIHLTPLQPASYTIPVASLDDARKDLNVQIESAQDKVLLRWSASEPINGNPDLIPSAGTPLSKKISITPQTPLELLYLHGVFLQKREDMEGAMKVYNQVLQRDSGYIPALLKEAFYYYRAADFQKSEHLIAHATERSNESPLVAYAAGVIYRADEQWSRARNAFWMSIHYGDSLPPGRSLATAFVELGEIEIRQGNYSKASGLLQRAIGYNPADAFALTDLAVAERLSGDSKKASLSSEQALEKMPLLPYALAEHWQDNVSQNKTTAGLAAMLASSTNEIWTKIIGSDPQNYLAIASWYHDLGAWQSSDVVLHAAVENVPAGDLSPMVFYYLASNARQEGEARLAKLYGEKAASLPSEGIFPNRITDAAILTEAIHHNPADAHAKYALGNFLFAHARYDEAAGLWLKALDQGFNNPVLLRNLGVYEWHVKKNLTGAAQYYVRAIHLSPSDYRLYAGLDEIYEQQGNTTARTDLFRDAPAEVLNQDTVRARHALLLIEQSKPDEALALLGNHGFKPWEGGVVVHNMFVLANMEKGKSALTDHHPIESEHAFRQALQYPENLGTGEPAKPDTAEQLYWLGIALQAQGKSAEARSVWQSAASQADDKTDVSAVFSALAYKKLGETEQAQEILERSVQSAAQPDAVASDYFAAGMAELYSGQAEHARNDFRRALQLDPSFWQVRVALDQLGGSGGTPHNH
jgi:tetratricopeptide (TPR) repeat protein